MKKIFITIAIVGLSYLGVQAQSSDSKQYMSTMDFLTIGTDARSAGMANTGLASTPDVNSHQSNPSKYIFSENKGGLSAFYSPWLRKTTIKDMGMYALSGFYKFDTLQTISSSFRYFSMGDISYYTTDAQPIGDYSSYELAFDAAYARRLSKTISASVALRYAYSKIVSNSVVSGDNQGGSAVAADISMYYFKPLSVLRMPSNLTFGLAIANLGTKVSYGGEESYFLPAQLKLGGGLSSAFNSRSKIGIVTQFTKYLVPTDAADIDESALSGAFGSFSDFGATMQWSLGAEYDYNDMLKLRAGYFTESANMGNRQYATFGLGGKYKSVALDLAYFVATSLQEGPMSNTIQISLSVDFPWKN